MIELNLSIRLKVSAGLLRQLKAVLAALVAIFR